MAAHDLRSPLTAIHSAASLLEADLVGLGPENREDLSTLRTSAEFMRRLVDDFLSVALIEAGHLDLKRRGVTARALVEGALHVTSHAASRRGRAVEVELVDADVELSVDPARVEQVLMNLVNNAVEHSPPGAVVTVRFAVDGHHAVFSVSDQGGGIAPEVQGDLFKAYVHGADKSIAHRSIGRGLAIAKLVVDAHGGAISAPSTDGGSTFTVSLPR
jgi:signal transduction histidine kinase